MVSVVFLLFWFLFKYSKARKLAKAKLRRESKDLEEDSWTFFYYAYIYYSVFCEFVPCMFGLHLIFSVLAYFTPIAHSFHLFLVIYLSTTARYVIKSTTEHVG